MRVLTLGLACAHCCRCPEFYATFYKGVTPRPSENCQNCHRPGEAGPMSFLSYEARGRGRSDQGRGRDQRCAVVCRSQYGHFENDRRRSEAEFNTLISWVDTGATAGNPKDAPNRSPSWRLDIGKPDVVFRCPPRSTFRNRCRRLSLRDPPTNFTEDKYVQFAESRPATVSTRITS